MNDGIKTRVRVTAAHAANAIDQAIIAAVAGKRHVVTGFIITADQPCQVNVHHAAGINGANAVGGGFVGPNASLAVMLNPNNYAWANALNTALNYDIAVTVPTTVDIEVYYFDYTTAS